MKKVKCSFKEKEVMVGSSPKSKIIKNGNVNGIVFCSPTGHLDDLNNDQQQDHEQLQALELFWKNKGMQEGEKKGYEEGLAIGEDKGFQKGYKKGLIEEKQKSEKEFLQQGTKIGYQQAKDELNELTTLFTELSQRIISKEQQALEDFKKDLFTLCLSICEKIIRQELSLKYTLETLINKMMTEAKSILLEESTDLFLSQKDHSLIQNSQDSILPPNLHLKNLNVLIDPFLSNGDFRIVTNKGLINYDINRLLNTLNKHVSETIFSPEETIE
jgi:flagellar assembly protein FliH